MAVNTPKTVASEIHTLSPEEITKLGDAAIAAYQAVGEIGHKSIAAVRAAGDAFAAVKRVLSVGKQWMEWCEKNRINRSTAHLYMEFAARAGEAAAKGGKRWAAFENAASVAAAKELLGMTELGKRATKSGKKRPDTTRALPITRMLNRLTENAEALAAKLAVPNAKLAGFNFEEVRQLATRLRAATEIVESAIVARIPQQTPAPAQITGTDATALPPGTFDVQQGRVLSTQILSI